jgi:hypothetical protein
MKWSKLTIYTAMALGLTGSFSCEEDELQNVSSFSLPMSSAQEVPANASGASGTITGTYDRATRILNYTVSWTGLTGPVAAMHIHGIAEKGVNAGILQNIITSSNGITTPGSRFGTAASFSASLFIDGLVFKEDLLLDDKYYINIHTATYPGGEIRGQLEVN